MFGILFLFTLCKSRKSEHKKLPFSKFRLVLAISMLVLFIFCLTYFKWWFSIVPLNTIRYEVLIIAVMAVINFIIFNWIFMKIFKLK